MKFNVLIRPNKHFLFSFVFVCFLSIFYLYFFDVKLGFGALAILIVVPIFSYFLTLSAVKKIDLKFNVSNTSLIKGKNLIFTLDIKTRSFAIIPFLRIKFLTNANLITDSENEIVLSIINGTSKVINQQYTATIWGVNYIGIEYIEAADFFGIFDFFLKSKNNSIIFREEINILPNIPDIYTNDLLKECLENCLDEEETNEQVSPISGTPGFEYRKYVPGDSLKRINWKLSSKRREYMVRLYEPVGKAKQVIIIDSLGLDYDLDDATYLALKEQKTIEAVLGMLGLMIKQQLQCSVYYFMNEQWQIFIVNNESDLENFQFILSKYKFINKKGFCKEIPQNIIKSTGSMMYFANTLTDSNYNQISQIKASGSKVNIVLPDSSCNLYDNSWFVNDNFEFIRLY